MFRAIVKETTKCGKYNFEIPLIHGMQQNKVMIRRKTPSIKPNITNNNG